MGERNEGNDGNVRNHRGNAGNQDGNAGNQGGNVGNGNGNAGNQSGKAGNQGGNAGKQGDSLWESLCLLLYLKSRSARRGFHHPAFMGSCPSFSGKFVILPSRRVPLNGNEDLGSVHDFIFLYLCLVWIRRIRTQEEFKILDCYFGVIYLLLGGWWTRKGRRVVGWEGGKGAWG